MNLQITSRPSWLVGLGVGAIVAPALIALFFLGERIAGLPFLPFDVFDAIARTLPGGVITFGIDRMIDVLTLLGLGANLDTAAKTAEHIIGIVTFAILLIVLVGALFGLLNRLNAPYKRVALASIVWGAMVGGLLVLLSLAINRSATAEITLQIVWILLLMVGWGMVLGNVYQALCQLAPVEGVPKVKVESIDRRQFLVRLGGATAAVTVLGTGLAEFLNLTGGGDEPQSVGTPDEMLVDGKGNPMPNANDPLQAALGTRREYTPVAEHYRIDISSLPPSIDGDTYQLPIGGEVENPVTLSLADIRALPSIESFITMSCISNRIGGNLISTTKWTGVPFKEIINLVKPKEGVVSVMITGADEFDEFVSYDLLQSDERIMLAYEWDDKPLATRNGFPLRVHVPDRYGMKQPKWITNIEFVTRKGEGYWVRRGWSEEAIVNSTSVIDTVAADAVFKRGGQYFVPMGGIAWAGAKGISKVEVRVNEGQWQEARLRAPLSDRTWVIWRYDWAFAEGTQRVEVRCYNGEGELQTDQVNSPRPDGATGIHSKNATLSAANLEGV